MRKKQKSPDDEAFTTFCMRPFAAFTDPKTGDIPIIVPLFC
jgi:hypothetical protein